MLFCNLIFMVSATHQPSFRPPLRDITNRSDRPHGLKKGEAISDPSNQNLNSLYESAKGLYKDQSPEKHQMGINQLFSAAIVGHEQSQNVLALLTCIPTNVFPDYQNATTLTLSPKKEKWPGFFNDPYGDGVDVFAQILPKFTGVIIVDASHITIHPEEMPTFLQALLSLPNFQTLVIEGQDDSGKIVKNFLSKEQIARIASGQ